MLLGASALFSWRSHHWYVACFARGPSSICGGNKMFESPNASRLIPVFVRPVGNRGSGNSFFYFILIFTTFVFMAAQHKLGWIFPAHLAVENTSFLSNLISR